VSPCSNSTDQPNESPPDVWAQTDSAETKVLAIIEKRMIHVLRPRLQVLPATPRCLFCVEGFVKPGSTSGVCIGVRSRHALSEKDLGETLTVLHTAARRCGHDGRSVG
jgi:hypothetical protein